MESKYLSGLSLKSIERQAIRKLFVFAVFLGALGVIAGTLVGSSFVAIGIPLFVMALYIFYTQRADVDIPAVIVGDSYYYLGFVFTLVALTSSLFVLQESNVTISKVIGTFGAAMLTTIVGLVSRLVTTTFSVESAQRRQELDRQIERELDKFLEQLRTMTGSVSGDFLSMSMEIKSAIENSKEALSSASAEISKETKSISKKLEKSTDKLVEKINEIQVDPDIVESKVIDSLKKFDDGITSLQLSYKQSVSSVLSANSKLIEQYEQLESKLVDNQSEFMKSLSNNAEKQLQNNQNAIRDIALAVKSNGDIFKKSLIDSNESISNQITIYEKNVNQTNKITETINDNVRSLELLTSQINQTMKEHYSVVMNDLELFDSRKEDFNKISLISNEMSSNIDLLNKQIVSFNNVINSVSPRLKESTETMVEGVNLVKGINELIVDDMKVTYSKLSKAIDDLGR